MNDEIRAVLIELVATQPPGFVDDHMRVEAHLRDLGAGHRTEVRCLVAALDEGVVERLRNGDPATPVAARVARLSSDLADQLAMRPDAALWAVESWAQALGLLTQQVPSGEPEAPSDGAVSGACDPPPAPGSGIGALLAPAQAGASGRQPWLTPEITPPAPAAVPEATSSDTAAASGPKTARRIWVAAWPLVAAFPVSAVLMCGSLSFSAANSLNTLAPVCLTVLLWFAATAVTAWRLHVESRWTGAQLGCGAAAVACALLILSWFIAFIIIIGRLPGG